MRPALGLTALLVTTALAAAQERPVAPDEVPPRYGLPYKPKAYPQATPKQALQSVITAADGGDVNYLVAHLLDPVFVDARVEDRAKQVEPEVGARLSAVRDAQLKSASLVPAEARVPVDPALFRARVAADARAQAFAHVVRGVQAKMADDPEAMKDLRRFNSAGTFPDAGATDVVAKVGLPDVKDRAVFMKKIGDRWYVENRQADEKLPEAKPAGPKKDEPKKD